MTVSQEDAIECFDDLPDEVTDHLGEVISKFPKTLDTREDIAVLIAMVTVAIYDGMVADGWHKHADEPLHLIDFGDFTLQKGTQS